MQSSSCSVSLDRAGNDDLDDGVAILADALRVGLERLLRLLESVAVLQRPEYSVSVVSLTCRAVSGTKRTGG